MRGIIYTVVVILLAIWLVTLITKVALAGIGLLFHLLLIAAIVLFLWHLTIGRRRVY